MIGKSVCHVFSVAIPTPELLPRGFHAPEVWVFDGGLLQEPCVRAWLEDPGLIKACHNLPMEQHTFHNHGVRMHGGVNTLEMARFWYPERAKREGFTLDSLGTDFCGVGKTEDFNELLGYDAVEYRDGTAVKRRCECGVLSCLKRSVGHKEKTPEEVPVQRSVKVRKHIPLPEITPAHRLWARYLAYSAWDAILALWIYELMMRDKRERSYPWNLM